MIRRLVLALALLAGLFAPAAAQNQSATTPPFPRPASVALCGASFNILCVPTTGGYLYLATIDKVAQTITVGPVAVGSFTALTATGTTTLATTNITGAITSLGVNAGIVIADRNDASKSSQIYRTFGLTRLWDNVFGDVIQYDTTGAVYVRGKLNAQAGLLMTGGLQVEAKTVATLPACSATTRDQIYAVTDATAPTYRGALTGGGAVRTPVYCDGSAWTAH